MWSWSRDTDTVELRRPVAVYVLILLTELVAILVVLECVMTNFMDGPYKHLRSCSPENSRVNFSDVTVYL